MAIQTFRSQAKVAATQELAQSITSVAQVADPLYALAIRFYEAKNYPKALRLMEYLLRSQEPQFRYLRTAAIILQADQQFDRAITFYERAAKLDAQKDPLVSLGHAQCLVLQKQYSQAMPYLEETRERLKNPAIAAGVRNQLLKVFAPLMERVQELSKKQASISAASPADNA